MAKVHGKLTEITVDGSDISPFCKTSSFERGATVHDTTGYGVDDETKSGGLRNGKFSMGGTFDNTAVTGPGAVLDGQEGSTMAIVRKIEGTGTGKPQQAFSAVLSKYVETNPHDDMVSWSAEFEKSGPVTTTTQA